MKIYFKKIVLHHFLSFGDAEIDLANRDYCLVKGINHNPKDDASSNGSGKSSWLSGISWALTGETVQGVTNNIPNIYYNDGCYVTLYFSVNNDEYEITRYKNYEKIGTNLKVIINGEDKSGKGIRESEAILHSYLPDLTAQLLCSVVILGQGLPQKFSNNTPSGRKEVLEKLSKSDFMIEDIKSKIAFRINTLNTEIRKEEDELLKNNSQLTMLNNQLISTKDELSKFGTDESLRKQLQNCEEDLKIENNKLEIENKNLSELQTEVSKYQNQLNESYKERDEEINRNRKDHEDAQAELSKQEIELNSKIIALQNEIKQLKSITDICPTCHQKIPNVQKPDTSEKEKSLAELNEQLKSIKLYKNEDNTAYNGFLTEAQRIFNEKTKSIVDKQKEAFTGANRICSSSIRFNKVC